MHIFMEMFRMNGANERGSTIDVARDKSSRADRDCKRYAIRKIQYNVSLRSFFFFPTFHSRSKERVFIVNDIRSSGS